MPVTAKLSKAFYERLGEDITNELVEWFNLVDATYRSDLREINELNFARFDAKVEQRLAVLEAKWDARFTALEAKTEVRLAQVQGNITAELSRRFDSLNRNLLFGWFGLIAAVLGMLLK